MYICIDVVCGQYKLETPIRKKSSRKKADIREVKHDVYGKRQTANSRQLRVIKA